MNWKMFAFMILLPIINGERKYRKLTKHVLPNHKIINPLKEEGESYYYSLKILFVPFRNEAGLILDWDTVSKS